MDTGKHAVQEIKKLPSPKASHTPENKIKQYKILHANTMVQTMGNTHLDLRYYARLHDTIHCGINQHDRVMLNLLATTILAQ